jgi:hypothetical protein
MQIALDLMEDMQGNPKLQMKREKLSCVRSGASYALKLRGGGDELLYCLFGCNFSTPSVLVYKATS